MRIALATAMTLICACAHTGGQANLYNIESRVNPSVLTIGKKAVITIEIKLKPGGKFSDGSPIRATLNATNISVKKYTLSRDDAVVGADTARFEIPVIPINKGTSSLDAELSFYVCTDRSCDKEERHVETTFVVK